MSFPIIIQQIAALVEGLLPENRRHVAAAARDLSFAFTLKREQLHKNYFTDPAFREAYLAAFLLPNAAKVAHALEEALSLGWTLPKKEVRILDLGAGLGTASLAAAILIKHRASTMTCSLAAMDASTQALEIARDLVKRLPAPQPSFETIVGDVTQPSGVNLLAGRRFDLILAANVLNELTSPSATERLVHKLLTHHIVPGGLLVVIDPALRTTTRPLMALRNTLLDQRLAHVLAPCTHTQHCPMLAAGERDWCHFYLDWERPAFLAELDVLSGMDHRRLKFSYLLLAAPPEGTLPNPGSRIPDPGSLWRIVSSPLDSRGKREFWLCGGPGTLRRVRRLTREASEKNGDADRAVRGDIVNYEEGDRIGPQDSFTILQRWRS
jgi:ribosomal protein RSM22 (predicted rRNA methylase)